MELSHIHTHTDTDKHSSGKDSASLALEIQYNTFSSGHEAHKEMLAHTVSHLYLQVIITIVCSGLVAKMDIWSSKTSENC